MTRSLVNALVIIGISGFLTAHGACPSAADEAVFRHVMGVGVELGEDSSTVEPVSETDRVPEFDSQTCGSGYSGLETRTRDAISWSDGSTTYGEWSEWDNSSCVPLVPPIWETSTELPGGTAGESYSADLVASDEDAPVTYDVRGNVPDWLTLNSSTGALSGTPTVAGRVNLVIRATDATGSYADRTFTIDVAPPLTPPIWGSASTLSAGTIGVSYSETLVATDDDGAITYSLVGEAPDWLDLNATTGLISGTPDAIGTASFTIRATDARGAQADRSFSIEVTLPMPPEVEITGVQLWRDTINGTRNAAGYTSCSPDCYESYSDEHFISGAGVFEAGGTLSQEPLAGCVLDGLILQQHPQSASQMIFMGDCRGALFSLSSVKIGNVTYPLGTPTLVGGYDDWGTYTSVEILEDGAINDGNNWTSLLYATTTLQLLS